MSIVESCAAKDRAFAIGHGFRIDRSTANGLLLALLLLPCVRAAPASAHGEAEWIMKDPTYVSAFGQHCCGPQDCERIPASFIREEGRDIHLLPTGQIFRKGAAGAYPSRDGSWWWCKQQLLPGQSHPLARCVFFPFHGF